MKKVMLSWLMLLWLAPAVRAEAARPAGFVALYRGQAWVERAGQKLEPRTGLPVYQGDFLVTGRRGRLKVLFSDDALVSLGSRSRVEITRHLYDPAGGRRSTRLHMLGGKLRALVQRLVAGNQADFEVHTKNAVAGVRGTEFVVEEAAGQTRLYTLSGAVAFARAGREPVLVAAGYMKAIDPGDRDSNVTRVADAELKRLRAETDTDAEQQAVAMLLPPRPTESLSGPGGRQPAVVSGAAADQQPGQPGAVELEPGAPQLNFGDSSDLVAPEGGNNSEAGFFGDGGVDIQNDGLAGGWTNPDLLSGVDSLPVTLHIVLHR